MLETLKKGMNNSLVMVAKYLLGCAERKTATEEFDQDFYIAVKRFQEKNYLIVDGIIGPRTWRKIAMKAPLTSYTKNRKSRETCAIQILLGLEVTGIFGWRTRMAVKQYQRNNALESTGFVDLKTWYSLLVSFFN